MEDRNEYQTNENTEADMMEEMERQEDIEDVMPQSLEEFLAEHPVIDETEEIILSERLKNFTFKVGLMSKEQRGNYFNICMIKDRKGRIVKQDMVKFNELVVVNHCIYPNFSNVKFVQRCSCKTPSEALYKVLKVGEIERLSQKIMEFNGFDDFEDLRKKAKN